MIDRYLSHNVMRERSTNLLVKPVNARNKSHHCGWSTLPNSERKIQGRAWNNYIIIDR